MKLFCKKVFIITFFLLLFFAFEEFEYRSIPNNYTYKQEYLDNNASKIEILNLGSSLELNGIIPGLFHRKAFNAAISAQSPEFDYKIFEKYKEDFSSLRVLILPMSYFTLRHGPLTTPYYIFEYRDKWNFMIPYHSFTDRFAISAYTLPIVARNVNRFLFLEDFSHITVDSLGWEFREDSFSDISSFGKQKYAKIFSDEWQSKCDETYLSYNKNRLFSIIEWCRMNNVEVILLSTPLTSMFCEHLDINQQKIVANEGFAFEKQFPNVTFVDLIYDTRFSESDFYNANHLNQSGATKLTLILDSIIEKRILN